MNAPTALLALLLFQAQPAAAPGQIGGVVRGGGGDGGGAPLPYALVEVVGPAGRTSVADATGRYLLQGLAPGFHRLRAIHVGHAPLEVEVLVPSGGRVDVDLDLLRAPVELPALLVTGSPVVVADPEGAGPGARDRALQVTEVALRTLSASPGLAESGVGEAAQGVPGDPSNPRDVLLMRGSTADLKLVLLDGAPVYTPFHLGGLLESLDPASFGSATLHVGGAPARYDGGLSYILDLHTRSPRADGLHASGAVDLLSARASVEGPLPGLGGLLLSGRWLHRLEGPLFGGAGSPYGYGDALARWEASPAQGHRLSVTGFVNDESVFLDFPGREGLTLRSLGAELPDAARWGNRALSATWEGRLGATDVDMTAAASRYDASLPIRPDPDGDAASRLILARSQTDRVRVTADAARRLGEGRLRIGVAADRVDLEYDARRVTDAATITSGASGAGTVVGAYLDASRPLAPGVALRAGVRADRFSSEGGLRLAPRASLAWTLGPQAVLTLAAGRYHQYTRTSDTQVERAVADMAEGAVDVQQGSALMPVASADHMVLSLDQVLAPTVRLGLEGFVKAFDGVSGGRGSLTSSGMDVRVVRQGDDVTAWLGYSLAWFWADDDGPDASTTAFTGRHLLSTGLSGRLAGPVGADLRLSFSDGLPYTSIPLGSEDQASPGLESAGGGERVVSGEPALGGPAEGFLRLDAEVDALWTTRWSGRDISIRPYVRVLNALDRRDALFWYFEPWRDAEVRPLAELSMLPVLGLEWRF
ncbi:MAG: TonB-dependent receptor [Gemmatimonadetes bacterium]|nr:TonB-dependent receptor [Gemmatimonadota bacterium]